MSDDSIKRLLNLPDEVYTANKSAIDELSTITQDQLKSLLSSQLESIPSELEYIIPLVVVKRYRRLGNEGLATYSQSEQSKTYLQTSDFDEFMTAIEKANDNANTTRPTTWFI